MSNPKLDEIAARADAATKGPWETIQSADEETTTWLEAPYDDVLHHDTRGHGHMRQDFAWMKRADAEFIAHAREDVPKLLAALRAVEAVHEPVDALMYTGKSQHHKVQVCVGCGQDDGNWNKWPCPTLRAVREALGA